jgi:hypothetical protein
MELVAVKAVPVFTCVGVSVLVCICRVGLVVFHVVVLCLAQLCRALLQCYVMLSSSGQSQCHVKVSAMSKSVS